MKHLQGTVLKWDIFFNDYSIHKYRQVHHFKIYNILKKTFMKLNMNSTNIEIQGAVIIDLIIL